MLGSPFSPPRQFVFIQCSRIGFINPQLKTRLGVSPRSHVIRDGKTFARPRLGEITS
ncbi:hypothetical protein TMEC54S_00314 [Thauera mechernichensis]